MSWRKGSPIGGEDPATFSTVSASPQDHVQLCRLCAKKQSEIQMLLCEERRQILSRGSSGGSARRNGWISQRQLR